MIKSKQQESIGLTPAAVMEAMSCSFPVFTENRLTVKLACEAAPSSPPVGSLREMEDSLTSNNSYKGKHTIRITKYFKKAKSVKERR